MTRRLAHWIVSALFITLAMAYSPSSAAADRSLPDWSGWWYLQLEPHETPLRYFANAPFRPEIDAKLKALGGPTRKLTADEHGTPKMAQCQPSRFNGFSGGFVDDIEFLFTPGRVTLLSESGLTRRIFLDPAALDDMEVTDNGLATGHWEGRTLVVETRALNPNAYFGPNWPGNPTIGNGARVHERISLRDAETLEMVVRIEAPALFTQPFVTTFVYLRDRGHRFHEQSDCVDEDRSIDPVSGGQRFDLTPPSNLPPPPPG
jgi:hypothetical protein